VHEPTRFSLIDGLDLAGLDLNELWCRYMSIGGDLDPVAFARCLAVGIDECDPHEHDVIAQALNEAFFDIGCYTFPVAYATVAVPSASIIGLSAATPIERSAEARREASLARLRSGAAARRSADLQAAASRLMRSSGQLKFAQQAETRARAALARAVSSEAY
jgi:hypothetical protein